MKTPITQAGLDNLKHKFNELKKERVILVEKKEEAYAEGDPAENTEYILAVEELKALENVMSQYEEKIFNSEIVDPSSFSTDSVKFGLSVILENVNNPEDLRTFTIVGTNEVDVNNGRISNISPLGKSLMFKVLDDEVFIGEETYFIKQIFH